MKRRIVQETVKKQSKNKTENENSQEYFTMNSFMSKVHSKEEFENQPIPEKCINSTDNMVETIDEFVGEILIHFEIDLLLSLKTNFIFILFVI